MPFTANMIFTTEQQAQSTEVKERVYTVYKKSTYALNFEVFTSFRVKRKKYNTFFIAATVFYCEYTAFNTILCQVIKGNGEKYKLHMKLKAKNGGNARAT